MPVVTRVPVRAKCALHYSTLVHPQLQQVYKFSFQEGHPRCVEYKLIYNKNIPGGGQNMFTVVITRNIDFMLVLYVQITKAGNLRTYEIVSKCTVPL